MRDLCLQAQKSLFQRRKRKLKEENFCHSLCLRSFGFTYCAVFAAKENKILFGTVRAENRTLGFPCKDNATGGEFLGKVAGNSTGSVSSRECLDAPAILATFTAGRTGLVACP